MKRDMADRSAKTKAALDALDPATRVAMEGHRPGAYVRLRFTGVPCELVTNFDPRFPILVSGRGAVEARIFGGGWVAGRLGGWAAGRLDGPPQRFRSCAGSVICMLGV